MIDNMRLLVNINIKSISNAITNSSSEVFLVKSKRPAEEIKELILAYSEMAYNSDGIIDTQVLSPKIKRIVDEDKLELSNAENERCSGMGGDIEVYDFSDASYEYKEFYHKDILETLKERGLTEDELNHYVLVDIDWARKKTIDFLFSNFKCINCEIIDDDKIYSIYEMLSYGNLKHTW